MSIATKTGDDGSTGLMFNRRVDKSHVRVQACGACDELNSALGLARSFRENASICEEIFQIQKELVIVMGELATELEDRARYVAGGYGLVSEAMADRLTRRIEAIEAEGLSYEGWETPGLTPMEGALHLARSICRRAERAVHAIGPECRAANPQVGIYLNRLSDLLFLYARLLARGV